MELARWALNPQALRWPWLSPEAPGHSVTIDDFDAATVPTAGEADSF